MYYWNQEAFEDLTHIAGVLEEDPRLALLAAYCRGRERGLRREAFKSLNLFLDQASTWEVVYARRACTRILELDARMPQAHQFLSHPLLNRLVLPVLNSWMVEEPTCQTPVRWLGVLRGDTSLLKKALALNPDDVPVRRQLAIIFLASVEYATHHLVESRLLGDIAVVKRALNDARAVLESAPDDSSLDDLLAEVTHYDNVLQDWEAYSAAPRDTFPEWCAALGRSYEWPAIYYYEK